jgi:hypothetical protein
LSKTLRQMDEGRDTKKDIAALGQRFDLTQWLLNGDDEDSGISGDLPGRNT